MKENNFKTRRNSHFTFVRNHFILNRNVSNQGGLLHAFLTQKVFQVQAKKPINYQNNADDLKGVNHALNTVRRVGPVT